MSTLVTGGAGFIGSHLVEALLDRGDEVTVVDDFNPSYAPERKERNLERARRSPRLQVARLDVRDLEGLQRTMVERRVERVIHLAAWPGVRPSIERPRLYVQNNVEGTQAVLDACGACGVRTLVFASSSSVYGNDSPRPSPEDAPAAHPLSPYAATKRAGELLCHAAHHAHGLDVTCLRFFTAVGPRQRPDLAVHRFAAQLARGEEITLFGDGSSERDYTAVADIVDGIVRAVGGARGFQTFNLGAGRPVRLRDVVATVAAALGVEARVKYAEAQRGDVDATLADLTRVHEALGYAPRVTFADAAAAQVEWMRAEGLIPRSRPPQPAGA